MKANSILLDPRTRDDLDWFFNACHHDLGVTSNCSRMLEHLANSGNIGTTTVSASREVEHVTRTKGRAGLTNPLDYELQMASVIGSVSRHRRIRRALMALDSAFFSVIEAVYSPESIAPDIRHAFALFAGVAVRTQEARRGAEAHNVTPVVYLQKISARRDAEALAAVEREVHQLVVLAHAAYEQVAR